MIRNVSYRLMTVGVIIFGLVLIGFPCFAQSVTLTVITANARIPVRNAKVLIDSAKGYLRGSIYQDFGGLYITEAIAPPEGVRLKLQLVKWAEMKEVQFLDWGVKIGTEYFTKGKLTLANGSTREVFIWNISNSGYYHLSPGYLKVTGNATIGSGEQEIEIIGGSIKGLVLGGQ